MNKNLVATLFLVILAFACDEEVAPVDENNATNDADAVAGLKNTDCEDVSFSNNKKDATKDFICPQLEEYWEISAAEVISLFAGAYEVKKKYQFTVDEEICTLAEIQDSPVAVNTTMGQLLTCTISKQGTNKKCMDSLTLEFESDNGTVEYKFVFGNDLFFASPIPKDKGTATWDSLISYYPPVPSDPRSCISSLTLNENEILMIDLPQATTGTIIHYQWQPQMIAGN